MIPLASLTPAAACFYDRLNAARNVDEIDGIVRGIWASYGTELNDDECTFLTEAANNRRPLGRAASMAPNVVTMKPVGRLHARIGSRFTPRQRQRSPDRKASRDRRRMLGGSSALPDNLRHHYTEGQRAVLCIVAGEVKRHGICDLPIDKIAALAGVCRTTVQTAMHEARRLMHIKITERPVPGRKSLPNIVEVISPEWKSWLKRGPSAARLIGSKSVNLASTTKNTDTRKKEASEEEKSRGPSFRPPDKPKWERRYASR